MGIEGDSVDFATLAVCKVKVMGCESPWAMDWKSPLLVVGREGVYAVHIYCSVRVVQCSVVRWVAKTHRGLGKPWLVVLSRIILVISVCGSMCMCYSVRVRLQFSLFRDFTWAQIC